MKRDRTGKLLAALRILKAALQLQLIHYQIPIDNFNEWVEKRDKVIKEICYDIYYRIILPCLKDYEHGILSREEQRMLASVIKIITEEADWFPNPWYWSGDILQIPPKSILEYLNKCRDNITCLIKALNITDIASFKDIAGDFIKMLSPDSQFLDNRIVLKNPESGR